MKATEFITRQWRTCKRIAFEGRSTQGQLFCEGLDSVRTLLVGR
jgi:hypothetical protein